MKHHKYTKDQLVNAITSSTSVRQSLLKLNIAAKGGNYRVIKKAIKLYDIDVSHFKGQGWNKGNKYVSKRPIEDYLTNNFKIQSNKLRLRLLKDGIFSAICNKCENTEWLGKPIPLELEHKDGNSDNNELCNLELLCPNCHAQTETYRGKNIKKVVRQEGLEPTTNRS